MFNLLVSFGKCTCGYRRALFYMHVYCFSMCDFYSFSTWGRIVLLIVCSVMNISKYSSITQYSLLYSLVQKGCKIRRHHNIEITVDCFHEQRKQGVI